jgi:hypothetical protein
LLALTACASSGDRQPSSAAARIDRATSPPTVRGAVLTRGAEPLPAEQARALAGVGVIGPQDIPVAVVRGLEARGAFSHGQLATPSTTAPAEPGVALTLGEQLAAARVAATRLARLSRLEQAGYYLGSYYVPGVGVHYIDWSAVGASFDPARPAMLLVDATPGHRIRLAGFSYWVRSDGPPVGFAGDTDQWHRHFGLCFVQGILDREDVASASQCAGTWVNGSDLWMLHAWVVPGFENAAGVFAPRNLALCPARTGNENTWC